MTQEKRLRARDLVVDGEKMMQRLTKLGKSSWFDPDLLKFKVGEDKPERNILRPIGDIEHASVHYLQDFIGEGEGVDRVPVCPGRNVCPVCEVGTYLYNLGTEAARNQARSYYATERNYWNVFPLWEYNWGDEEPGWKVLSFGRDARKSLVKVLNEHGPASSYTEGYDLVLEVLKKKGGYGNEYEFLARTERKKIKGTRKFEGEVIVTDIPSHIWDLVPIDLSKFTTPASDAAIEILAEKFSLEAINNPSKGHSDLSGDEEDDLEDEDLDDDSDDDEDDLLCFGNSEVYNKESTACSNCPRLKDCGRTIRLEKMQSGEAKGNRRPRRTPRK